MLRFFFLGLRDAEGIQKNETQRPSTLPCCTLNVTWTLVTGLPRLFRMMLHVPLCPAFSTTDNPFSFAASETAAHGRSNAFSKSNKNLRGDSCGDMLGGSSWSISRTRFRVWLLHLACSSQGANQIGMGLQLLQRNMACGRCLCPCCSNGLRTC